MISDKDLRSSYILKQLQRYNHRARITSESVAEHSFYTSLFTKKVCDKLGVPDDVKLKCLEWAIVHDTPETQTSDIPYDVKRNNPRIAGVLDMLEFEYLSQRYPEVMQFYGDPVVKDIVKIADLYSVVQYCISEKDLGNTTLKHIEDEARFRIKELEQKIQNKFK